MAAVASKEGIQYQEWGPIVNERQGDQGTAWTFLIYVVVYLEYVLKVEVICLMQMVKMEVKMGDPTGYVQWAKKTDSQKAKFCLQVKLWPREQR